MKIVKWSMATSSASPVGWEWRDGLYAVAPLALTRFWFNITLAVKQEVGDE